MVAAKKKLWSLKRPEYYLIFLKNDYMNLRIMDSTLDSKKEYPNYFSKFSVPLNAFICCFVTDKHKVNCSTEVII